MGDEVPPPDSFGVSTFFSGARAKWSASQAPTCCEAASWMEAEKKVLTPKGKRTPKAVEGGPT